MLDRSGVEMHKHHSQMRSVVAGLVVGFSAILFMPHAATATILCSGDVRAIGTACGMQNGTAGDIAVGGASGGPTNGTMTINGGSVLTTPSLAPYGAIAESAGSSGTVAVTGAGSTWTLTGEDLDGFGPTLAVGRRGDGTLNILDGGRVEASNGGVGLGANLQIGGTPSGSGNGTVLIDGTGSTLAVTCISCPAENGPGANIGRRGNGSVTVQNGGSLIIDGFDASLTVARGLETGADPALGILNVNAGTVTLTGAGAPTLHIGRFEGDDGRVTLSNASVLTITGDTVPRIFIGRDGTGELNVLSESSVLLEGSSATEDTGIQISQDGDSDGDAGNGKLLVDNANVTVRGTNAFINVGTVGTGEMTVKSGAEVNIEGEGGFGFLNVGRAGQGTLTIDSGGQVNVSNAGPDSSVFVASGTGSVGTVIVNGAGSELDSGNLLAIGLDFNLNDSGGTGTVSVRNGGAIRATETYIGDDGFLGGNGTIFGSVFNQGGTVDPGLSPGHLAIDGDFIQEDGVLEIEIAGLLAGQFDVLTVSGLAEFTSGSILLSFIDDFLPQAGDAIEFLTASAIAGLENVTFLYAGAAPGFDFRIGADTGGLTFVALNDATSVPEPATSVLFAAGLLSLIGIVWRSTPRRRQLMPRG